MAIDFTHLPLQYWTESFVQWSPLGTYLATVHRQGAAVWGGDSTFNRLMRYAHPQVFFLPSLLAI
jgi:translation initiation factor 3 subunit B